MATDIENTALLVMDVQPGIVGRLENKDEYLRNVSAAVTAAHKKDVPVIYVVVGFRAGYPEVSARNKSFSAIRSNPSFALTAPAPAIEPVEGDVVVVKRRVSAFSGSDLEVILRAKGITHLVLSGIATSGVVLSTTREAADKDYQLTILSDLCADFDPEVHKVLLEKILTRQADIIKSDEWISSLG
jgi:nicotinamidase-related amidase